MKEIILRTAGVLAVLLALASSPSPLAAQNPPPSAPKPPADDRGAFEITPCERRIQQIQEKFEKNPPPKSFGFPARPEIEYENSLITFRICEVKKGLTKEQEERRLRSWKCCDPEFYNVQLVKLDAYMRLCREEPVINELGFREMRFTIEKWELFGKANLFGGDLVFSATPNVVQPKSLVFSTRSSIPKNCQDRAGGLSGDARCEEYKGPETMTRASREDYPAMIIYNAIYDVWLNGLKIVASEPGIAMARGVTEIPPTGVTVAFQKPVETRKPDGTIIKICPGTCSGMRTIPVHEFQAGLATADSIKKGQRLPESWQPKAVTTTPPPRKKN